MRGWSCPQPLCACLHSVAHAMMWEATCPQLRWSSGRYTRPSLQHESYTAEIPCLTLGCVWLLYFLVLTAFLFLSQSPSKRAEDLSLVLAGHLHGQVFSLLRQSQPLLMQDRSAGLSLNKGLSSGRERLDPVMCSWALLCTDGFHAAWKQKALRLYTVFEIDASTGFHGG